MKDGNKEKETGNEGLQTREGRNRGDKNDEREMIGRKQVKIRVGQKRVVTGTPEKKMEVLISVLICLLWKDGGRSVGERSSLHGFGHKRN
jgi:hypothetical protein